jgi:hypothetical protein
VNVNTFFFNPRDEHSLLFRKNGGANRVPSPQGDKVLPLGSHFIPIGEMENWPLNRVGIASFTNIPLHMYYSLYGSVEE